MKKHLIVVVGTCLAVLSGCASPFAAPIVKDVEKHGGSVSWEWTPELVSFHDYSRSAENQMDDTEFAEAHRSLHWLHSLKTLDMTGTNITDESLPIIAEFRGLRRVYLAATYVTPRGIAVLKRLPKLDYVTVPAEQFSDDDVRALREEMRKVRIKRIPLTQAFTDR